MINYNNIITGFYLSLASPTQILLWATRIILNNIFIGNIITAETINYKTGYPKESGLFCEKIFGPLKTGTCNCNNYTQNTKYCFICKKCGVEVNNSKVRKFRMGCLKFKTPLFHPWYYITNPSILSLLLNVTTITLLNLIYYKKFNTSCNQFSKVVNLNNLTKNILNFKQYLYFNIFTQYYLKNLNSLSIINTTRENYLENNNIKNLKFLYILDLFYINKINLSWIMLEVLPIIPPELRPIIKISNNNYVISNINEAYITIILHNNNLKKFSNLKTKNSLLIEVLEKYNLQKSLEIIFENKNKYSKEYSLSNILLGKYGRFRQDLLGKRVDFSSRSVIISGPDLNFINVGIPITIALSLFKPLLKTILNKYKILKKLLKFSTLKYSNIIIRRIITRLFKHNMVIINRAPTLHRMNIQAFKPYLIENYSIKLYPLACAGFNADFDGDQMSMLLSLTKSSRLESKSILSADKNIISPATGNLIYKLHQGINLGLFNLINIFLVPSYYYFKSLEEIFYAFEQNLVTLHDIIWFKNYFYNNLNLYTYFIINKVGRIILNTYLKYM